MKISAAVEIARKSVPDVSVMTDDQLARMVSSISDGLKGYGISQFERIALNEDRHACRREIARRAEATPT